MAGIAINTTAKIITPAKFQKRCESLLKQKFVRFTEEEKKNIKEISQNPDVSTGFDKLKTFLRQKFDYLFFSEHCHKNSEDLIDKLCDELITPEKYVDSIDNKAKIKEKFNKLFSDLLYKPSSTPDILNIEQNLRKKGVKAKFSDNSSLDFAKLTQEALGDIEKKGFELPKRIIVSEVLPNHIKGLVNLAPTQAAKTLFINNKTAALNLNELKIVHQYPNPFWSVEDPKHLIYHEAGHWLHSKINSKQIQLQDAIEYIMPFPNNTKSIISQSDKEYLNKTVSGYSCTDRMGFEAVAEIFAGIIDGKTYPPEVMAIYKKLKGPITKKN
jgi:hypothetical protein